MMKQQKPVEPGFCRAAGLKYPYCLRYLLGYPFQFVFQTAFYLSFCIWSISLACLAIILHKILTDYWMKFLYIFIGFFFAGFCRQFCSRSQDGKVVYAGLAVFGFLFLIYILITDRRKELKERGSAISFHSLPC
jgi:hypothetical protein